ncbi:signal transduction histidine kinase [Orenia metallireducens]|jgi:signal transduction histidine kinase|uniref:histidine kinase n=1 Tax=Orenia metallireducens TaxID=1413210 RepID=A0A285HZ72_9FIRM|nr:sensor histidine kinase [Orenia metallireducens]PRX29358.1 signal transduction histidine kinase [Orenia metallireducens]SNY40126.1 Signal transduction histidine kinase [Orenia metallireducens]
MIEISNYLIDNKYLNLILLFFILLITYIQSFTTLSITQAVIFSTLFILLIINDCYRCTIKRNTKSYSPSLALSLILASLLKYLSDSLAIYYFYFFYIIDILYLKNIIKKFFLVFHFLLYLTILNLNLVNFPINLITLETNLFKKLLVYFSIVYISYITHSLHTEKEETKKLNKKLNRANIKLHQYSQKVKELSTTKERERVAQELHDSLGHSLMALTMHLNFLEKTFTSNPAKTKQVIVKAKELAKISTSTLREAVTTLKDERNIESLRNSINELIDNFLALSNITIDLIMEKELETLNPDLKLCIYKTIRESITNGIKHGNTTVFKVKLYIEKNTVILKINDNGIGCDKINMSNGLKGIQDRIFALGGSVFFSSQRNKGFFTEAKLPIDAENEIIKIK